MVHGESLHTGERPDASEIVSSEVAHVHQDVEHMRERAFLCLVEFASTDAANTLPSRLSDVQDALHTVYNIRLHFEEFSPRYADAEQYHTLPLSISDRYRFLRILTQELLKYPPFLIRQLNGFPFMLIQRFYEQRPAKKGRMRGYYGSADSGIRPKDAGWNGFNKRLYVAVEKEDVRKHDVVGTEENFRDTVHHELLHLFYWNIPLAHDVLEKHWDTHLRQHGKIFWIKLAKRLGFILKDQRLPGFLNHHSLTRLSEQVAVVGARLLTDPDQAYGVANEEKTTYNNHDLLKQFQAMEHAFNALSNGLMNDRYFRLLQSRSFPFDYWLKRREAW